MHDYRYLAQLMERTIHKYMQVEKQARPYGTDTPLTQSEIHTIAIVGDSPGINVTRLAKLRGVTKGAASQMVYRLVDKGLIEKQVSPNSDTEVCLNLTEKGQTAFQAHMDYHEEFGVKFFGTLNDEPEEVQNGMIRLLEDIDKYMDELLEK